MTNMASMANHGPTWQAWPCGQAWPSMATMAENPWRQALKRRILPLPQLDDISVFSPDLVISGSSIPDYDIPANACIICESLGIDAMAFDANSACSSFVTNLLLASSLIKAKQYRNAAIFNIERYSTRLDFSDRSSSILFGDGATSTIIETIDDDSPKGIEIIDLMMESDPRGASYVTIPVDEPFRQNGSVVQKFAISKTVEASSKILLKNQLTAKDVDYFIGHQANLRMLQSAVARLDISQTKHLYNVDQHGNQGAAGAPSVISAHWNRFKSGDMILIAVVGSGLTWGAALLRKI